MSWQFWLGMAIGAFCFLCLLLTAVFYARRKLDRDGVLLEEHEKWSKRHTQGPMENPYRSRGIGPQGAPTPEDVRKGRNGGGDNWV